MSSESQNLKSRLCGHKWQFDPSKRCYIKFNEDGTGELRLHREVWVWIAAPISWSSSTPLDQSSNPESTTLSLSIKLQTEPLPGIESTRKVNADLLTEAAFEEKRYKVTLESGRFTSQYDSLRPAPDPNAPVFGLKLAFEPSPYPPREEWKKASGAPDKNKFWEWTDFFAEKIEENDTPEQN